MMTEACGATNFIMMEVGGAISSMMKVCGATKSISRNYIRPRKQNSLFLRPARMPK